MASPVPGTERPLWAASKTPACISHERLVEGREGGGEHTCVDLEKQITRINVSLNDLMLG